MREASRMEWRVGNNKFSVMNARSLAQWRLRTRRETKNEQIHQLHSMYIPFDAAPLYGRPYKSRQHLYFSCYGDR